MRRDIFQLIADSTRRAMTPNIIAEHFDTTLQADLQTFIYFDSLESLLEKMQKNRFIQIK